MKQIFAKLLAVVLVCGSFFCRAQNNGTTLYFSTEEMPNLIKCLPAPPDTIGEDFTHDIMRYMWGKTQRSDAARAAIAERDAVWSFDALLTEFNVPFGLEISEKGTPEIYKLMVNSLATIDQMRVEPKAYYMRKRPFVRFQEHMLTVYEEDELRNEGSYPSGHSQRGYAAALLLSEVNPANADTIMARGYMYGESRVIVGAHWQSDVDASRLGAAIGLARLHTSPAFLEQLS
jgi:acid phosphatase (class A)